MNIRRMSKNFEPFQEFYKSLKMKFNCFSDKRANDSNITPNSLFQLEGYNPAHQIGKNRKGGEIVIFVCDSFTFVEIIR